MSIEEVITAYVADALLAGDAEGLDAELPLAEMNIIDSAAMFDLVHFLQSQFQIGVPLGEVAPANFATIGAITQLVERLRASQAVSRTTENAR